MHHGGSDVEILVELIVQVESKQGLALSAIGRLVLKRHTDVCSGIDNALVDYSYDAHVIVNCIVAVFGQGDAAGSNHHRTTRHVHGIEANLRTARCLILTFEDEFILVLKLSCYRER